MITLAGLTHAAADRAANGGDLPRVALGPWRRDRLVLVGHVNGRPRLGFEPAYAAAEVGWRTGGRTGLRCRRRGDEILVTEADLAEFEARLAGQALAEDPSSEVSEDPSGNRPSAEGAR